MNQDAEPTRKCALVVDDEFANRDFLVRLLQQAHLDARGASTAGAALKLAAEIPEVALLVIDHRLPDMSGVELMAQLRARYPSACAIMATMHDERALMQQAFENGCNVFLVKPHGFMELFRRLQSSGPNAPELMRQMIIDQYGFRPYRG